MGGARRKPSKILEINGSFSKHPDRKRARQYEPVPTGDVGDCPDHLKDMQHVWDEIVNTMPAGVMGNCDRISLETLVRLVHKMRTDFQNMPTPQIVQMRLLLGQFGMTPADRSRISVQPPPNPSPFQGM